VRPPDLNEATLDALYETSVEGLPEKGRWLDADPNEVDDRYVIIGEEVALDSVTRRFGGCWQTLADALESYDWNAGVPAFVVDLFSPPESAVQYVTLTPSVSEFGWGSFDDRGIA
jgi:hypothetical protein